MSYWTNCNLLLENQQAATACGWRDSGANGAERGGPVPDGDDGRPDHPDLQRPDDPDDLARRHPHTDGTTGERKVHRHTGKQQLNELRHTSGKLISGKKNPQRFLGDL